MKKSILSSLVLAGVLFSSSLFAGEDLDPTKKLLNIAGKQRMLSQRIVKDYLYMTSDIAQNKASAELKSGLEEFEKNKKFILESTNSEDIKNLVSFINMSLDEFKELIKEPGSVGNYKIAVDLGETILEGSQFIFDKLDKDGTSIPKVMAVAAKQRMLAQRIAKYYIAYQSGIKDKNTVKQMHDTVKEFKEGLDFLMAYEGNTPKINLKLKEVNRLWNVVYKFYNQIETGGLPFIVFTSTDKITKEMNQITEEYAKLNIKGDE